MHSFYSIPKFPLTLMFFVCRFYKILAKSTALRTTSSTNICITLISSKPLPIACRKNSTITFDAWEVEFTDFVIPGVYVNAVLLQPPKLPPNHFWTPSTRCTRPAGPVTTCSTSKRSPSTWCTRITVTNLASRSSCRWIPTRASFQKWKWVFYLSVCSSKFHICDVSRNF